ncbi:transmembrane protein 116 isoform X6 [Phyllopteryx taeniolatus]|uniref:transmembrane protein 116 isoform X6 n=1 Tax=Phyllopteryx taeniolatus TaxID=161469 RepID=UPI002AD30CEE|nr:transmembrane protein 116 isoform X6 [Phyllopteryx taeniolatus]
MCECVCACGALGVHRGAPRDALSSCGRGHGPFKSAACAHRQQAHGPDRTEPDPTRPQHGGRVRAAERQRNTGLDPGWERAAVDPRHHRARQVVCIASFFYTLNYVWNVYARLRLNLWCVPHPLSAQHAMPSGKMTALLSGVAPPLLMAPVFIGGSVGGCVADCSAAYRCLLTPIGAPPVAAGRPIAACRPLRVYGGAVFLAAFLLTLVGMLALMGKCRRTYRRVVTAHGYLGNRQRASLRALDLRMLAHSLVFAVCWAPTACLVAVRATTSSTDVGGASVVVLYVAQVGCLHATFGVSARVKGHLYVRAHGRPSRRRRRASSASPRWRARAAHRDGFRRGATPTRRRRCCERRRRARGATELEDRAPPVRRHPRDSAPLRRCYCE